MAESRIALSTCIVNASYCSDRPRGLVLNTSDWWTRRHIDRFTLVLILSIFNIVLERFNDWGVEEKGDGIHRRFYTTESELKIALSLAYIRLLLLIYFILAISGHSNEGNGKTWTFYIEFCIKLMRVGLRVVHSEDNVNVVRSFWKRVHLNSKKEECPSMFLCFLLKRRVNDNTCLSL